MPNNNKSIELQLIRRFLQESQALSNEYPSEYTEHLLPLLSQCKSSGSTAETLCTEYFSSTAHPTGDIWSMDSISDQLKLPKNCSRHTLNRKERDDLFNLYCKLYSVADSSSVAVTVSSVCMRYSHLSMYNKQLGSFKTRMSSSSVVIAEWDTRLLGPCCLADNISADVVSRAARIDYFCKHVVTIGDQSKTHMLVHLSWFLYHPQHAEAGKPITIWYNNLFEPSGIYTLVPVQFVKSRAVSTVDKLNDHDSLSVLFVIPCINF